VPILAVEGLTTLAPGMRQILTVLASAAILWLAFPPADLGFLVFVAPAPFLWTMRRVRTPREAGWLGFLFAGSFFGMLLSWLLSIEILAWLPVVVAMGLWGAAFALVLFVARSWSPWRWWVIAVGGWALWEFLRARLPFGGLPWGSLGHPVGTLAWPRGAAQWIGASGWAVIVAAFAAGIVLMLDEESDRRQLELTSVIIFALTMVGAVFVPDARGAPVRVAVVQGGSPCPRVHCDDEHRLIFDRHLELTTLIEAGSTDLIVWGEDSFGGAVNPTFDGDVNRSMAAQVGFVGAYLLAGGTRPGRPGEYDKYNVVFGPTGEVEGTYLKRRPVPFGEYVPLRRVLQFIPRVSQTVEEMTRGAGPVVFPVVVGGESGTLGSLISYEAAFPGMIRETVRAGAQMMVVTANTASFGEGAASDQLIGMLRIHAASVGVDVVVASITGRSGIVRADGSLGRTTDLFEEDILRGMVNFQVSRRTVYTAAGDWLQAVAIIAMLVVLFSTVGGPSRDFKIRPEHRR
jgi:apolipoprotein N-acyltransferase